MQRNSQHSQIPQQIHVETQNKNKSKNWLRQSLLNIQNNVASDAHHILQKNQRKTFKLKIKQKIKQDQHMKQSRSLDDLKMQQYELRNKLKNIKNLEKTIRLHKSNKSYNFKVKSNQQLKQLTKKYRKFKEELLEKSIILKERQQKQKQHIKKLEKQHMQTECEERRKKIMKKLQKMQKRRIKRRQEHKQQKLKLKQLKKQKLFQKMKQNFNIKNNQMNQEKYERYQRIKKQFQINISSLSQHEKNYQQAKRQKEQKRTIRMTQSRLLPDINFYKSRFLDQIMENERLEKQKANQTMERRKLIHQKHKQFQEKVYEEFAPPLKQNSGIEEKQNKKVALDYEQIKKKGNQLYKQGQKYVIPVSKREQYAKLKALQQPIIPKTYPNYLAQLSKLPHTKKSYPSFYKQQLNKVQNAIKSQKISKHDKLQHVKILMQKMQNTSPPNLQTSENQLLARLQAKLKLLELLQ